MERPEELDRMMSRQEPRTETADPTSDCAMGTKAGAGETVVDILRISRGAGGLPPIADLPLKDAPPTTKLLP